MLVPMLSSGRIYVRGRPFLAADPMTARTHSKIAKGTKVSGRYLSEVLKSLHRGGIVVGQRGVHGGFRLVKSPEQFRILEVLNAAEPQTGLPPRCTHGWRGSKKKVRLFKKAVAMALETAIVELSAPSWTRTRNPLIKSQKHMQFHPQKQRLFLCCAGYAHGF